MKKYVLFVAIATLMSTAAMGERVRPTFNGAHGEFLAGETVYLLHAATNQFYCAGNDYGTHASLSAETGIPVVFEATEMDNGDGFVVYQIKNFVPKHADWKYAFLELEETEESKTYHMYTDYRAQPDIYFCVEETEERGIYLLYGSNANEVCHHSGELANFYIALDPNYTDKDGNQTGTGVVYASSEVLPQNTWKIVYADEYDKYQQQWAAYNAAQELAALIAEAEEYGVDTQEAQTAYDDLSLSEEQLKAAYRALLEKISKYYEENVSPSEPVDMGKYIENADFETSYAGWTNDNEANTFGLYASTKWAGFFDGKYLSGENALEVWSGHAISGSVASQTIDNIPNGVYAFSLSMYAQQDGAYVYAGNFKTPVKVGMAIAGDEETKQSYAQEYTVLTLVTDNHLQFGYWAEQEAGFWSVMDNAHLLYYGTGEEAYGEWVDKSIEQAEDFTDAICQPALIEAYNTALQNLKNADVNDGATLMPIVQAYLSSMEAVKSNIAKYNELSETIAWAQEEIATRDEKENGLWETYVPKVEAYISDIAQPALTQHALSNEEVDNIISGLSELVNEGLKTYSLYVQLSEMRTYDLMETIEKYGSSCSAEALANAQQLNEDILAYMTEGDVQNNEELREWIRKIEEAIKQLRIPVKEGTDDEPVDYTYAIVNPGFDGSLNGWTNEDNISTCQAKGDWGLDGEYFSGTSYLNLWDNRPGIYHISQTIENLPSGTYDVCAAAFTKIPGSTYIFANGDSKMINASDTDMDAAYYHVITKVTDGTLKLGVIIYVTAEADVWSTVDNFSLYSYGPNSAKELTGDEFAPVGVSSITAAEPAAQQVYDLSGRRIASGKNIKLQKGIYIINGHKVWVR